MRNRNLHGQSLPKNEILRKRSDFDALFDSGEKSGFGCVTVIHRAGQQRRVGFAVSRGIRSAAGRNRVKRLLREAYRRNKEKMANDREFVLVARESASSKSYVEIERDLIRSLGKAGIVSE